MTKQTIALAQKTQNRPPDRMEIPEINPHSQTSWYSAKVSQTSIRPKLASSMNGAGETQYPYV